MYTDKYRKTWNYNYYVNVASDVQEYLEEYLGYSKPDLDTPEDFDWDDFYDECFTEDSVTGNASGSYTFNTEEAKEYVTDNMDLLKDAYREFGYDEATISEKFLDGAWEDMDVTIRCFILSTVINDMKDDDEIEEILQNYIDENKPEEEEEEDEDKEESDDDNVEQSND